MARRKVSSNTVERLGKQCLPEAGAVKLALELEAKQLYLRAAKQWGVAMQEQPAFAEYIAAQRSRCIELSNIRHEHRIEQYEIRSDIKSASSEVGAAYERLCLKDNTRWNVL